MPYFEKCAWATAATIIAGPVTYFALRLYSPSAAAEFVEDNLWAAYFVAAFFLASPIKRALTRAQS